LLTWEAGSPYQNETQRVRDFIRDSSFTCNTRYLTEAYQGLLSPRRLSNGVLTPTLGKTYNLQYSQYPGWHATDLLATFVSPEGDSVDKLLAAPFTQGFLEVFDVYKAYLAAFITKGDPNAPLDSPKNVTTLKRIHWPRPVLEAGSQRVGKVLDIGENAVRIIEDAAAPKLNCDFFQLLEEKLTNRAGYAPDGSRKPRFDDVFGGEMPHVKIDTVMGFPQDVPPTVPFDKIAERLLNSPKDRTLGDVLSRMEG
jgi:hypothetical protein